MPTTARPVLGAGGTARESKHFLPALHPLSVQEGRTELVSCTLHFPESSHPSAGTWAAGGMRQDQPARKGVSVSRAGAAMLFTQRTGPCGEAPG